MDGNLDQGLLIISPPLCTKTVHRCVKLFKKVTGLRYTFHRIVWLFPRTLEKYAAAFSFPVPQTTLHSNLPNKLFGNKQMDCDTNFAQTSFYHSTL